MTLDSLCNSFVYPFNRHNSLFREFALTAGWLGLPEVSGAHIYRPYNNRTRVRSLVMLVTNSLTDSLTHCCLVNLIDVTLRCEDANSKLVEVVTIADVDAETHVGNSLLQIWKLTFGPKAKLLFRL